MFERCETEFFKKYKIKDQTFFKVGGDLSLACIPSNIDELHKAVESHYNDQITVLGECSNVLIRDGGILTPVILMKNIKHIKEEPGVLRVGGGCRNSELIKYAEQRGISGLEFLAGIPGSVGAGVKMNAGCFGSEFKDIVESISIIDSSGKKKNVTSPDIDFVYRGSNILDSEIIVEVNIKKNYGDAEVIRQNISSILKQKTESQQYGFTCGCVFKNGKDYFAGELIDKAGLKGYRIGGAYVSMKHANFIINDGTATSNDIEDLISVLKDEVLKKFGISMNLEIKILGNKL